MDSTEIIELLTGYGCTVADSDETLIQLVINSTLQYIKNFCYIDEIPDEMHYIAVEMAAGRFLQIKRAMGFSMCDNVDLSGAGVQSITEGDASVTFNSEDSTASKYEALIDKLCNRDAELVTFRRLRW